MYLKEKDDTEIKGLSSPKIWYHSRIFVIMIKNLWVA
jgi:hypothetical protein